MSYTLTVVDEHGEHLHEITVQGMDPFAPVVPASPPMLDGRFGIPLDGRVLVGVDFGDSH